MLMASRSSTRHLPSLGSALGGLHGGDQRLDGRNRGTLDLQPGQGATVQPATGQKAAMRRSCRMPMLYRPRGGQDQTSVRGAGVDQRSQRVGTAVEVQQDLTDAATTMFARMLGSKHGEHRIKAAGSNTPSLIAAGAGARFAGTCSKKMSVTTAKQMFVDAISEPTEWQTRPDPTASVAADPKQMTQQAMQMNAWAVSLGASMVRAVGNAGR